jgi:DNA-binding MarR family transcriptional regulator
VATERDTERRHAWRDVFEAHAAIMELLATELKDEVGISVIEYDVLLHLSEMSHPVRMHELAEAVVISKSGLTRVVDRMESNGLLARLPIARDRRSTAIELTRPGERVFQDARRVHRRGIKRYFIDHLSEEDAKVIRRVFGVARDAARGGAQQASEGRAASTSG